MDTKFDIPNKRLELIFTEEDRRQLLAGIALSSASHDNVPPVSAEMMNLRLVGNDFLQNRRAPRPRKLNGSLVSVGVAHPDELVKVFVSPVTIRKRISTEHIRIDHITGHFSAMPRGGIDLSFESPDVE